MEMGNMTNRLGVAALCAGMGMSALAAPAVTTIDVSAGGALATPVALHVDSGFASWLASANWYEFASYGVAGTEVRNAQPLVRLVWGEAGRELVYTNLCAGATYEWEVVATTARSSPARSRRRRPRRAWSRCPWPTGRRCGTRATSAAGR